MHKAHGAEWAARLLLSLGALLPYWPLLTFGAIYVTDDVFASDIFNGELPARVLAGQLVRQGHLPVWTNELCSGFPLTGGVWEPLGLAFFSLFSPAVALDAFLLVLLLVAAHGTYSLARRLGTDRPGAVLAGITFAGSGYIACQLKHLSIVATVVWLPVGLVLLDRALAPSDRAKEAAPGGPERPVSASSLSHRFFALGLFGVLFGEQVLSGFPQAVYICALSYGAYALFRACGNRERLGRLPLAPVLLAALVLAAALGAATGAVVLLPLSELGSVSDRSSALGWEWTTMFAYWPRNAATFLLPYVNGDISDNTYSGPSLFWEDYGYVGAATFLLAIYGAARELRRPPVAFAVGMTVVAYLIVLGPATPVFGLLYDGLPGMKLFRLPTRFLIIVELGLALLGGIGLQRMATDLERRLGKGPSLVRPIVLAICLGTVLDLFVHQPRQNPMVRAKDWLAPPTSVDFIRNDNAQPRTFTPHHRDLHVRAFQLAGGWTNLSPYFRLRELLQPNTGGGFWNLPSADCYAGIAPRWFVDVWGDHNRPGMVAQQLTRIDFRAPLLETRPALPNVLKAFGVTHLLSPFALDGADLTPIGEAGWASVYRIERTARVRYVPAARHVKSETEAAERLRSADFDPEREVLLHQAPPALGPIAPPLPGIVEAAGGARVAITRDEASRLFIEADAPADGFLLLADTYYPGWVAEVDGVPAPIYRANLSVRAIQLPQGQHTVVFRYDAPSFFRGLQISLAAILSLVVWLVKSKVQG